MRLAKNELRQRMRSLRGALAPEEIAALGARAAEHVLALDAVLAARTVALYAPIAEAHEIDTRPIHDGLRARGVDIVYPTVRSEPAPLDFHAVADPAALVVSRLGIPQPAPSAPLVPLAAIDVFIIPGLAFDALGERLGWGRGHYDRTLASAPRALRVGLAFELQVVPLVPVGASDERVDVVVTERGARAAPPRRSR